MVAFYSTFTQLFTPLIVLCWKSRQSILWVDFIIESVLLKARRKKMKFYILMKKWEQLQLTRNNYKSKKGWGNYLDNKKFVQDNKSLSFWKWFLQGLLRRYHWDSLISGMFSTRVCMKFNFLSIQVIKSQLSLWISKFFSSNLSNTLQK